MGNKISPSPRAPDSSLPSRKVWRLEREHQGISRTLRCRAPFRISTDLIPKVLTVESVNYCLPENGYVHNTSRFEVISRENDPCLVVRRGQPFLLNITFNRPYRASTDAVSFIFTMTDTTYPSFGSDTLIAISLLPTMEDNTLPWSAVIERQYDSHVLVKIVTSPDSIVAKWNLDIDTKFNEEVAACYTHPTPFYLLFNPWCPLDSVYIEDDEERIEYVLSDVGSIYRGINDSEDFSLWNFAQYEKDILDCSLYLIAEIGNMKGKSRGDPVSVSRTISSVIYSDNSNGVLEGTVKEGKYKGGKNPFDWMGSLEILQSFYEKKTPVKYAQSWVFAGVATTICRALGLPCRIASTFASARDIESNLTFDYFVDVNGKDMKERNQNQIWSFHAWNEIWMQRVDLGAEFSGWQAIDPTPRMFSDNIHQCGPCSVAAVKLGDVQKPYDGEFLYSELNAHILYWKYLGEDRPLKLLETDSDFIGQNISTKAVGKFEREDITSNYKYPGNNSREDRTTMLKALKMSEQSLSRYYINDCIDDLKFDFDLMEEIMIGQCFSVILYIQNCSSTREYTISGSLRADPISCAGMIGTTVKYREFYRVILPRTVEEIKMDITFDEYFERLIDQSAFKITCFATMVDTEFDYMIRDILKLSRPKILILFNGGVVPGKEFEVTVKLKNPLPIDLRKAEFHIEGCNLKKKMVIKLKKYVPAESLAIANVKLGPLELGNHTIIAKFVSKELNDIDGFLNFTIEL